jgi:hypothetical protein
MLAPLVSVNRVLVLAEGLAEMVAPVVFRDKIQEFFICGI